jgi:hypothetical protein
MATTTSAMWAVMQAHLPRDKWIYISQIYQVVKENLTLQRDDLLPSYSGTDTDLRWQRNVRNVLQGKKHTGELRWRPNRLGWYILPRRSLRKVGGKEISSVIAAKLPDNGKGEYEVRTKASVTKAQRREGALLIEYQDWLEKQQRGLSILKYGNLRCDAYEEKSRNLIEAKSSSRRENIRMAVGQLFDYAFQGREEIGKPHMAILLPEKPDLKKLEWVSELGIALVWRTKGKFVDNTPNGQFTK